LEERLKHSFVHSFIHSFINSFIRSFIHSFVHSFIRSFIHSFIHTFIHLFIHSFIHSLLYIFSSTWGVFFLLQVTNMQILGMIYSTQNTWPQSPTIGLAYTATRPSQRIQSQASPLWPFCCF